MTHQQPNNCLGIYSFNSDLAIHTESLLIEYTRLLVTRWVKLSLNFELLEEEFLFYIYCQRID